MQPKHTTAHESTPGPIYQISVGGLLSPDWAEWFDGFAIEQTADGHTHLTGPVPDQASLYALLRKVRDLGLPLISVMRQPVPPDGER